MRAYDERGPLRIEMVHRPDNRDVAEGVANRLVKRGLAAGWRALASTLSFPMPWYRDLLSGSAEILPAGVRVESSLVDAVSQLQKQWGSVLWALNELGFVLGDVSKRPVALRGSQVVKLRRWAAAAEASGYDARGFREQLERLCPKSK
jgi:hypothetical protein